MESWSYVCGGGKEVVSSDTISSSDAFARSNNGLVSWDLKGQCSFGNNGPVLGQNGTEFREFGELDYTEHTGDELPDTTIRTALTSNPLIVSANSFALEDDFMSRLPSSAAMDSNGKDSCFIDLKLGRLGDPRDYVTCKGTPIVSSSDSSTPPKRIRVGLNALKVHCQVYGCNKDLSSSKEYHKRHRVCEAHSKTAKVIVNGIEQRFCQQCSRFHLLSEFDDVKRSCRKRLQGHNERRRKPQVGLHSGRAGRLLQSFSGFGSSKFHGRALAHSSFICQDIHPGGLLHPEKFGTNGCSRHIKLEDETTFGVLPAIPLIGSAYSESVNRHPSIMGSLSSGRRPLFQGTSLENEDFTAFDATSTVKGPSEITYSGRAFSLLSPQSSNSSSPSSGIPIARPVVSSGSDPRYCMSQIPEKLMRASSHASDNVYNMSNRFAPDMNSVEGSHLSPILISNHSNGFDTDGLYRGSHLMNNEHHVSSEDSSTINLLQLSSELQRVEHQKQSTQVKQETDAFCCPHIS